MGCLDCQASVTGRLFCSILVREKDGAMMKDKLIGLACLLGALAVLSVTTVGADEKKPREKKVDKEKSATWMQRKLEHSQNILAGLTKADFAMIEANAGKMDDLNYLEQWGRDDLPEYKRQLQYFSDANAELIRQAGKKNLGGATLAYTQLTLSCVHCHSVVRDVKKDK